MPPEGRRFDPLNWQILATMDELVHHCLRELAFDGDLGQFVFYVILEDGERAGSNLPMAWCRLIAHLRLTN